MYRLYALIPLALAACASHPYTSLPELSSAPASAASRAYRIHPGDELEIRFFATPELDQTLVVRPDGRLGLRFLDNPVEAAGLTPEELETALEDRYAAELREPDVEVVVRGFVGEKVYVGGEVREPGIITLDPGLSVLEAIIVAGGFTTEANEREVLVIRKDGQGHPVPFKVAREQGSVAAPLPATARLAPADVVYVPRSRVADANRFVEQYIRGLLMFDGFRISFGYDLDDLEDRP